MSRRLRRKIHKWLEEQDPDRKRRLFYNIMRELEMEIEARKTKDAAVKKRVWMPRMTAALACCTAVFLVVLLPFTLIKKGPVPPLDRYCLSSELLNEALEMNLRDYAAQNDINCLYLNWYDKSFVETNRYYIKDDYNDTAYMHEYFMDLETGEEVNYYVTGKHTLVDIIENYKVLCELKVDHNGVSMMILNSAMSSIACYSYGEYNYCVNISMPSSEDILFRVVEEMLATAQ